MLDKKQIFLFEFKWVVKQPTQLTASTMHLAQELLTNIEHNGGSRSFANEMRALKMRNIVTSHQNLMTTKSHHRADPLITT